MILTYLGAPRTATTSLFTALSNHKDIAPSTKKELFNELKFDQEEYLDQFEKTEDTKILLDGTPSAYSYFNYIMKMISKEPLIKIIYPIRDPYDRIYSTILQTIVSRIKGYKGRSYPKYISSRYKIINDKIMDDIPMILDCEHLKNAYEFTDDVFIFDFDKMDLNDIFNFLGVEPIEVELPKENTIEELAGKKILDSKGYKNVVVQLTDFFDNNDELDALIEEDRRKLSEDFNYS